MIILLAFILVPLAEIAMFITVGERIGLWPTLAVIVLTAIIGSTLLRAQGFAVLRRAQASMNRGELPVAEVFDGACLLFAGALLLTPGFLTDAVGAAMFVPAVRAWLGRWLFTRMMRSSNTRIWVNGSPVDSSPDSGAGGAGATRPGNGGRMIDGDFEVLDDNAEDPDSDVGKSTGSQWGRKN